MPLTILERNPTVKAVYRQPLNSLGMINTVGVPLALGWLAYKLPLAQAPFFSVVLVAIFLISVLYYLDRLFGRTVFVCSSSELQIEHRLFSVGRARSFNLMEMSEPFLTEEEWTRTRLVWGYERPSRMKFQYRGRTVSCCRRMTEGELWELLSAIRKNNQTVDRLWDSVPAPAPTETGPLNL